VIDLPPLTLPKDHQARILFFAGWTLSDIAKRLDTAVSTVAYWRDNQKWENQTTFDRLQSCTELRYMYLLFKENKSNADYKEFDRVCKTLKNLFFPVREEEKEDKKRIKAFMKIDPEEFKEKIKAFWDENAFKYQKDFITETESILKLPTSDGQAVVLKGRQTGFTWALAIGRALRRAVNLGHDQVYISSSQRQAFKARDDIKRLIHELFGVKVQGVDRIQLPNGAIIDFLGANYRTAQGFTGDVTVDEYAWMLDFEDLTEVVKACATLKQYNIVMSSTPSHESHPSYNFWMGITDGRKGVEFTYDEARKGILCSDGIYRKIITLEDAVAQGNNLISIERLKRRHPETYPMLFQGIWMKHGGSAFDARQIMRCMVDPFEDWPDVWIAQGLDRPYGGKDVVIGFDPAKEIDISACVVIALPTKEHPYHRVIEKFNWFGEDYDDQAEKVIDLTTRYNVKHIAIDGNGVGAAVHARVEKQLIGKMIPVRKIDGNPSLKNFLVMQMRNFFRDQLLRFDKDWTDVFESYLAIRPKAGRNIILYETVRTSQTAHADFSWAIMYGLSYINLDGTTIEDNQATGGWV